MLDVYFAERVRLDILLPDHASDGEQSLLLLSVVLVFVGLFPLHARDADCRPVAPAQGGGRFLDRRFGELRLDNNPGIYEHS